MYRITAVYGVVAGSKHAEKKRVLSLFNSSAAVWRILASTNQISNRALSDWSTWLFHWLSMLENGAVSHSYCHFLAVSFPRGLGSGTPEIAGSETEISRFTFPVGLCVLFRGEWVCACVVVDSQCTKRTSTLVLCCCHPAGEQDRSRVGAKDIVFTLA